MHTPGVADNTKVSISCNIINNQLIHVCLYQLVPTKAESLLNAMEAIQGHPLDACEALHVTMQQFVSQIRLLGDDGK